MYKELFNSIKDQQGDLEPDQVEELVLDKIKIGKFSDEITQKLETYPNLTSLSLNQCEIVSLENFPKLLKLIRVELIDNKITGQQLKHLTHLSELQSLSLGGNLIKSLKEIDVLQILTKLFQLDFLNNDVAQDSQYRDYIFTKLKSLGILDNFDSQGQEVQYDDDEDDDDDLEDDEDDDEDQDEYDEDEEDEDVNIIEGEDEDDEEEGDDDDLDEGADDDDGEDDDDDDDADAIEEKSQTKKKVKPN